MWNIILTAINAILPIILLIVLGYFLKRVKFLSKDFLTLGNKLVFRILLPVMLFINIYDSDWSAFRWDIILYALTAIWVIFCLGLLTCILTTPKPERRGVILQCTFRSNFAIIGTSLAASLAGNGFLESSMANVALLQAFSIPMFNILAVISLSIFVGKESASLPETANSAVGTDAENSASAAVETFPVKKNSNRGVKGILLGIVTNPLIIAVVIGLVCLGIRQLEIAACGEVVFSIKNHLTFLYSVLEQLKNCASPIALIVLGGQFQFSAVKGMLKEIIVGTSWRIVLAPILGLGVAVLLTRYTTILPLGPGEFPALVALFGSPVAISSAVMAAEMKNDEQLATQLLVWTSVLSIITIFVAVCVLMSMGYLAT